MPDIPIHLLPLEKVFGDEAHSWKRCGLVHASTHDVHYQPGSLDNLLSNLRAKAQTLGANLVADVQVFQSATRGSIALTYVGQAYFKEVE